MYGSSFATSGGTSTKYATAYSNETSTCNGSKAYEVSKIGDAIKETLNGGSSSTGWFSDKASYAGWYFRFFGRGGFGNSGAHAGVFCSDVDDGSDFGGVGFRAVLGR